MEIPPSVDRIRRVWQAQAGGARQQAALALLVSGIVGGAHVARLGTSVARATTAAALLGIVALQIALTVLHQRESKSTRLTVRRVVLATDPPLAPRAERALALVLRAEADDSVGDSSLALLHFSRLLDRVSSDAVGSAGSRYAQRFRATAIALLSIAVVAVVMGPARVVEGLDVLAARHGRAPLPIPWLGYARLSAQPPAYTRESERSLVFGTSVDLPKGTVLLVRGVALSPGRDLVVTDGSHEEPFSNDGSGGLVARYVVRGDVSLRVAARFGDVRIDDEESLAIAAVPDAPPKVQIEGAPKTVRLADVDRIDVRWTAEDDHGLREVDLVMRSGAREERRVLARFDGESKVEHGGRVIAARDAFLRRTFLPVTFVVEAKDNDPLDGPKWSESAPLVVVPPEVGEAEAARLAAIRTIRDAAVDLLAFRSRADADPPAELGRAMKAELTTVRARASRVLSETYVGLSLPAAVAAFFDGQLDRIESLREPSTRVVEDLVLAADAAISATGARDAADVAKRLGDVAEEAAVSARAAREREGNPEAVARLDAALLAIDRGASHLVTLASLGRDLGSVTMGDAGRIRRARSTRDFVHAELAALHLAERLRRPAPSFGATTGSGRGGGVESGRGRGGSSLPSPSSANEDFRRAANAVAELAEEHGGALHGVEAALEEASRAEPTDAQQKEAKRLADAVRRAVEPLPLPGQEFGTPRASAALAREHGNATAHALDDLSLGEARDSAESALASLDQAEKKVDSDDPVRESFGAARRALREAMEWAKAGEARRHAEAEGRAASAVRQAGDTEQGLSDRAEKLAEQPGGQEASLPRELAERLGRAGSIMREAARELAQGHGERGAELQREAQRLLEQAKPDRQKDDEAEGDGAEDGEEAGSRGERDTERHGERGPIATGGKVPSPDERARAEEFRRRVLLGLGKDKSERLSPAVQRYAEGLLR